MQIWKYTYLFLLLILLVVVIGIFQLPDKNLHIIACDVGQGDAILMTFGSTQILTDGGPDSKVLNCLGRYMPFWDRNIELVISTHPDADHVTGLVDVLERYKVDKILINPIDPGTDIYRLLEKEVGGRGVSVIDPVDGMSLGVGLIHLDILGPSENLKSQIANFKSGETNLYSTTYLLTYGQFRGLFLGDIPPIVSDQLAVASTLGSVNYIKVPHHGSKNGLTQSLLEKVMPKGAKAIGVISVSAKNIWGFPAPTILQMLSDKDAKVLRTDQMGDVEVVTDGRKYWWKK